MTAGLAESQRLLAQALSSLGSAAMQAPTMQISTRNKIAQTNVPSSINIIGTYGYASVGDNGAALYIRGSTGLGAIGNVTSADGAPWKLLPSQVHTPEMFAATANLPTFDNAPVFKNMATYINAVKPTKINFLANGIYSIYPSLTVPDQDILFNLSSVPELTMDFNGGMIQAPSATFAPVTAGYCFQVTNCSNFRLIDPDFQDVNATAFTDPIDNGGFRWINLVDDTKHVSIENMRQQGGLVGVALSRGASNKRCFDVKIRGYEALKVFYPFNAQKNGDEVFIRDFRATHCGRTFFIYNVRDYDVEVDDVNYGVIQTSCPIGVYVNSAEATSLNTLSNIRLYYHLNNQAQTSSNGGIFDLFFQQAASIAEGPGVIRDVDIELDCDVPIISGGLSQLAFTQKLNNTGAVDNVTRGHIVENVSIRGAIDCNGQTMQFMHLFDDADWSGENIRNFSYKDLVIDNISEAAIIADVKAFKDSGSQGIITFENVITIPIGASPDGEIQLSNVQAGGVKLRSVHAPNLSTNIAVTPTWSSTGVAPTLGNGTITGRYEREGSRVHLSITLTMGTTSLAGTGSWKFTIPSPYNFGPITYTQGFAGYGDSSTGNQYDGYAQMNVGSADILIANMNGTATYWGGGGPTPVVIGTGDTVTIDIYYDE